MADDPYILMPSGQCWAVYSTVQGKTLFEYDDYEQARRVWKALMFPHHYGGVHETDE